MESTTMTLAPFPAEGKTLRASWADWETQVFDYLEMATGDPWGLMGFAMPAEAFAIATDGAGVHAPQVLPNALENHPTAAQTAAFKYKTGLYLAQQKALKQAKITILASLNEEAKGHLTEPTFGVRRRTLLTIMDILRTEYGVLTAHDLEVQKMELLKPYPINTPIRDYIRQHRDVHTVCAAAGQPMSAADKVHALRLGAKHVPPMVAAIQHYLMMTPNVAQQTFVGLATILGQAEDNGDPAPTTGTAGYSAAATSAKAGEPQMFTKADVAQMVKEAVAEALRDNRGGKDKSSAPAPKLKHYCWTHGPSGHPSNECKFPAEGHSNTATNSNRQGGASENPRWAKK